MEMLLQPPPGAAPPPPDQTAKRSWSWLAGIVIGGVVSLVGLYVAFGPRSTCGKGYATTQAVSNLRQVGATLLEFESEYGSCPSPATVGAVKKNTGTTWRLEDRTSNGLLKQLIVTGIASSEEIFWCKNSGGTKLDHVLASEAEAIAKGECGFAYIVCDSPTAPRLIGPVVPGTKRFDPLDGQLAMLRSDGTVSVARINRSGRAVDSSGKDIFDPSHPHWGGKPFEVFYPE